MNKPGRERRGKGEALCVKNVTQYKCLSYSIRYYLFIAAKRNFAPSRRWRWRYGIVCDSMGQDAVEILKKLSEIDSGYMVCRSTYWVRKLGIYVERIREAKFVEGLKFVSFRHFNWWFISKKIVISWTFQHSKGCWKVWFLVANILKINSFNKPSKIVN